MKAILGNHKRALRGCTLGVIILGALVAVIGIAVVYRISRSPALAQLPTFAAPSSKEAWRQDLEFLATEIPRRHKDAFHAITRNQFENIASELSLQIPSLNNDQIVVALMKITASIGDGHTHVETPPNFHSFPITLYWFDDSLRVTKASPEYTRALGARVVQVGDTSIDDALKPKAGIFLRLLRQQAQQVFLVHHQNVAIFRFQAAQIKRREGAARGQQRRS
jgi:hypothetical protein